MEAFVVIAAVGIALLIAELLLPTGGVLATLGVAGLIVGGVLALGSDSGAADYAGPALIALGVACAVSFYVITRKVIAAHREQPVRAGNEELIGAKAEARSKIDPEGQVWLRGTLWGARLAPGGGAARLGDRVRVEAVEGLTLIVRPAPQAAEKAREGSD
jgi:membrane-bound serine protease (ClpP class)